MPGFFYQRIDIVYIIETEMKLLIMRFAVVGGI